jgi:hypothetical protein
MLLGLLAVAIPIAIHLFGRRRARVLPFAAVDFLLGSDEKVARRLRIRDLLLLALRILVCLAVPLVVAKPFTSCQASGPAVTGGPQAAVLVIDNSLASGYELDGRTLIEDAAIRAERIIDQLGPDSDVALVLTASGSPPPGELSADQLKVIDEIRQLSARPVPADTTTALRRAAELLATSPREARRIFLLTPLVASGFRAGESPWPAGQAPALTVVDLAGGKELPNLAVTGLAIERDPDSGSRGIRVVARVANFGAAPVTDVPARLRIDGRVVARGSLEVGAGAVASKAFSGSIPASARSAGVTVEIGGDKLEGDNRRHGIAELRDRVRTLLVNGDPRSSRHNDELFYFAAALDPGERSGSGIATSRTTTDGLAEIALSPKAHRNRGPLVGEIDLSEVDVIVLANSRALDAALVGRLANWVRGGGGLLVAMGDQVDAAAYNESMRPILAQELRSVLDTSFGRRGSEASGSALRLAKIEVDHPIFSPLSAEASELTGAAFSRIFLLGPTTEVSERRVLARYDGGATALVEAGLGRGRLLLYTSTLDRDWNELPIQPGFVPVVQQLIRYLGRKPNDPQRREGIVGAFRPIAVGADVRRVEIRGPSDKRSVFEAEELAGRDRLRYDDTGEPGFYEVLVAREGSDALEERSSEAFALNVSPVASDLARLDPDRLPAGAGGEGAEIAAGSHTRRVELWHAIAALLLGFLLFESVLASRS